MHIQENKGAKFFYKIVEETTTQKNNWKTEGLIFQKLKVHTSRGMFNYDRYSN